MANIEKLLAIKIPGFTYIGIPTDKKNELRNYKVIKTSSLPPQSLPGIYVQEAGKVYRSRPKPIDNRIVILSAQPSEVEIIDLSMAECAQ